MMPPDVLDGRGVNRGKAKSNYPRGTISGSGDEKSFICGVCGQSSVIKNNLAIVQEYKRLRRRFRPDEPRDSCPNHICGNRGISQSEKPHLYRRTGKTADGAQRWKCKACLTTFSVGSRIRRQKRSSANREVLWMITNGTPISKICDFTGLSPRDVYAKIDFIYERVVDFTARREGRFDKVDWNAVGRRFATDSQTLHLNWPNKKTRAQIAVHHLCTAHANSGYIVAAHLGLDPAVSLPEIEAEMDACGDFDKPRAFRKHGRVWSESEFKTYLDKITRSVQIHPMEAPEVELDLQLPHKGALIRQDITQIAHAFILRHFLGNCDERFVFVLDADSGLAVAFVSAFAPWIRDGRADVIVVKFDKNQSNDQRNMLVNEGRAALEMATGLSRSQWEQLTSQEAIDATDQCVEQMLRNKATGEPFFWPFHTKSEPFRRIRILTDRTTMDPRRRARLMRLATLRSVDAYFHKVRSNLRFAARPGHTPSRNGRAWDRHYLYNPETMVKITEIYRFQHNWMGSNTTKQTPAMKLGLAKGKIRPNEFFA